MPRRLQRGAVMRCGEQGRRVGIAGRVLGPQREKAAAEGVPENARLLEYPGLIGDAVIARSCQYLRLTVRNAVPGKILSSGRPATSACWMSRPGTAGSQSLVPNASAATPACASCRV